MQSRSRTNLNTPTRKNNQQFFLGALHRKKTRLQCSTIKQIMQTKCANIHEKIAWSNNVSIAGIDEAGRGPLCGPVVIGAVILPHGIAPDFLIDSKKTTEKQRHAAYEWITKHCVYTTVIVDHHTIDTINIYQATMRGMQQAYHQLAALCTIKNIQSPTHLVIDAMPLPQPSPNVMVTPIIRGESASSSIAAASIVAKVTRDELVKKYAYIFPQFTLDKHKGYGTAAHIKELLQNGQTLIHRKSFVLKPKKN
jgi:ribonuclease HII